MSVALILEALFGLHASLTMRVLLSEAVGTFKTEVGVAETPHWSDAFATMNPKTLRLSVAERALRALPFGSVRPLPGSFVQALSVATLATTLRMILAPRFFGWEEGDYGDLMMVREVLDSGFTWFRVAHMPAWYVLGAVARLAVPDARLSALGMTMLFSVATAVVTGQIARRCFGAAPGWLAGLWVAFQPESALYGASTLREPVYAAFGVFGAWALVEGRPRLAAALLGLAFLTRMEAFLTWMPAAVFTMIFVLGLPWRRVLAAAVVLLGPVLAWQAYVTAVHQEGVFFAAPLGVNLAGEAAGELRGADWLIQGLETLAALATWTLPRKLGGWWLALALLGAGVLGIQRTSRRLGLGILSFAVLSLGLWLGEGFLAHHEPNHNLYWSWLLPVVPWLALCAAAGFAWIESQLPQGRALRAFVAGVGVLAGTPSFASEMQYQIDRANRWYRPQLDLARWLEDELPVGSAVLTSSIPECWLKRTPGDLRVFNWWKDAPEELRGAPAAALGRWIENEGIVMVMWFREDWTDAPAVAPYLAAGITVDAGPVRLVPVDREDEYGWILFMVQDRHRSPPPTPPLFGRGVLGRGWR